MKVRLRQARSSCEGHKLWPTSSDQSVKHEEWEKAGKSILRAMTDTVRAWGIWMLAARSLAVCLVPDGKVPGWCLEQLLESAVIRLVTAPALSTSTEEPGVGATVDRVGVGTILSVDRVGGAGRAYLVMSQQNAIQ